jgi:two-component system sensor histidine kinase DesK
VAGYRGNGLAEELARAETALAAAGVQPTVAAPDPLPPDVAADATLGWVLRESVTNVLRHAEAGSCVVSVDTVDGFARLSVADDGIGGADSDGHTPSSGMRGLAERVRAADGTLAVDTTSGGGTRVTARVPTGVRPVDAPVGGRRTAP